MNTKTRRQVLRSMVLGCGVLGVAVLGYIPVLKRMIKRVRPPGAIKEDKFLAACIKCGQCVQACPVQAVKLADMDDGYGVGAPYIDTRAQACDFSCDAIQCMLACPTGALPHELDVKEQVKIGIAKLVHPETCLAIQGKGFKGLARGADFKGIHRYEDVDKWNPIKVADYPYDVELCDLCVRECPIEGAITLEPLSGDETAKGRKPEIHKKCVGCGMCEMICPIAEPCIVIEPAIVMEA